MYLNEYMYSYLVVYVGAVAGNVLLLRNNLNLGPDATEVSQEKLLSLVAERLIDSNSNVDVNSFLLYAI